MTQIAIQKPEVISVAMELKNTLKQVASGKKRLSEVRQIIQTLPTGTRFLAHPKGMCPIKIMGWQNNTPGSKISHRATVIDPPHTFSGVGFIIDAEGCVALSAGSEPHRPWARLPFRKADGVATFELAVVPPSTGSHLAEFV